MFKQFFFISTLIFTTINNPMQKRRHERTIFCSGTSLGADLPSKYHRVNARTPLLKKLYPQLNFFYFDAIPAELQATILNFYLKNIVHSIQLKNKSAEVIKKNKKIKLLMERLLRFRLTNKLFQAMLSSEWIIYDLSKNLKLSHETVINLLNIEQVSKHFAIQQPFKYVASVIYCTNRPSINDFVTRGTNINFTYDCEFQEKTAAMIAVRNNPSFFTELINHPLFNPNASTSTGFTLLHAVAEAPDLINHIDAILSLPTINVNQQTLNGVTPLLHILTRSYFNDHQQKFTMACKKLLLNGANPNIANNKGITPLQVAIQSQNNELILAMNNAIDKKTENK